MLAQQPEPDTFIQKHTHTHTHTYKHTQTPHTVIAYRQTIIIPYRTDKTVAFDMPIDWLNSKIW